MYFVGFFKLNSSKERKLFIIFLSFSSALLWCLFFPKK
ncbi:hypothetical protein DMC01_09815 [Campylobacter troglodytis]|nr:hypothetical protein DMC01_09815 [Campylobacter troglodytis]